MLVAQLGVLRAQEVVPEVVPEVEPDATESVPLDIFGGIEQPLDFAPQPAAPISLLLERLDELMLPGTSALLVTEQPLEIETVQLTRNSNLTTSNARTRRAQVAMQPTVRGYKQQSVLGQYQGARFVPVRYDLDSLLTSIDPGLIENLVIVPGPYGVRYGPGLAFIDVVARELPRSDVMDWASNTSLLYRSNGAQFYGREAVTMAGPSYGVRTSYGHKVGSDYVSGDGSQIPASYNVLDTDVAISVDADEHSAIQFEYLLQSMTDTEFAGLVFDARMRRTDAYFLRYTHDDPDCEVRWLAEGWYNRTVFEGDNLNQSKQEFYQANPVFVPAFSFIGFTDADVASSGGRITRAMGNHDAGELTAGADLRFVSAELNEFDDFDGLGFESFPVLPADMLDVGFFAELSLPVMSESRIKAGVRVDWVRTRSPATFTSFDPDGVEHFFDFEGEFRNTEFLYHGFVTTDHPLDDTLTLRAGFGHGQRPPDLTERFADDSFLTLVQNATSAVLGNESLTAERASQFDLSLLANYDGGRFRIGGYWSFIDEHITLIPAPEIPPDPDLRLLDFANQDSVLAGAEASVQLELTASLQASANVSYVDGRNLIADEPLFGIYPLQSRFSLLWREPEEDRYGAEFVAWVVDNQDRIATSLFEQPTAGFAKFDLRGYLQATETVRLTLGCENLGDRNYLEHLSVHNPQVLEPGFNFYLATQIER